jgi:uncharacterized RDD family membrane protein YckC
MDPLAPQRRNRIPSLRRDKKGRCAAFRARLAAPALYPERIVRIFLVIQGERQGPFTRSEVQGRLERGEITLQTYGWISGMPDWAPLAQIPGLQPDRPSPPPPPVPARAWELATLGQRFGAMLIDLGLVLIACVPIWTLMALTGAEEFERIPFSQQMAGLIPFFVLLLVQGVVQLVMLCTRAQTVGKWCCRIRIYDVATGRPATWERSWLLRTFVNNLPGMIPCLGLLYFLVDACFIFRDDRRCLHDLLAGTQVGTVPDARERGSE